MELVQFKADFTPSRFLPHHASLTLHFHPFAFTIASIEDFQNEMVFAFSLPIYHNEGNGKKRERF